MNYPRYLYITLMLVTVTAALRAEWSLYDGFNYNAKLLDGSDGGLGAWTTYWCPSGKGGVELESPGLTYRDRNGKQLAVSGDYSSLTSDKTAGIYRDFSRIEVGDDTAMVFWVSFIAQATGAPFNASGDELSIQLRSASNIEWVSFGIMGRLDAWRIRLSDGVNKQFSEGASAVYTDELNFFVARIEMDLRPGKADSVYLWVNPALDRQPDASMAALKLSGEDFWKMGKPVEFSRIRIGAINSEEPEAKFMVFDEIHMGSDFRDVAPVK